MYYYGKFQTCPFNLNELLFNKDSYCMKGKQREREYEKDLAKLFGNDADGGLHRTDSADSFNDPKEESKYLRAVTRKKTMNLEREYEHLDCCKQCENAIQQEKRTKFYQEIKGISFPTELGQDRFQYLNDNYKKPEERKLERQQAHSDYEERFKGEVNEWVQCVAGYNHAMLLNSLG